VKIIALGDIHGRSIWKKILEVEKVYDKVIFIGDYFDSKENILAEKQLENFKEIVALKELEKEKVILLFGNHDFHYLKGVSDEYSGYQKQHSREISRVINEAYRNGLFKMCLIEPPYLFSHAGLTKTWCAKNLTLKDYSDYKELEEEVNDLFYCFPMEFKFIPSENGNKSGEDIFQSPIWVRPEPLLVDKIAAYQPIVGHTVQDAIDLKKEVILIDALGTSKEYLVIEDGALIVRKLRKY